MTRGPTLSVGMSSRQIHESRTANGSLHHTDKGSGPDIPNFEIYLGSNHHFDQNEFRKISSVDQFELLFCLDFGVDSDAVDDESLE